VASMADSGEIIGKLAQRASSGVGCLGPNTPVPARETETA
jgi:hypothetical protein